MKGIAFKDVIYGRSSDRRVEQIGNVLTNADYEILLSGTSDDNYYIGETRKTASLTYNPSTNQLKVNGTAVLTQHQDISGKVNKSGDIMTGGLLVQTESAGGAYVSASNGVYNVGVHIGTGGVNHGLYDFTPSINKWLIYNNGTDTIVNGRASENVLKSGDTMTGILNAKFSNIDLSKANNNVSSVEYPTTFNLLDTANRIMTRVEGVITSDGKVGSQWYVRNYDTSGTLVAQKGITMRIDKSGTLTYEVSDAANFRQAIGVNNRAGSSTDGGSATYADKLLGFTGRATTQTWGVQIGTVLTSMWDSNSGGWGFRTNCPSNGKLSSVIDGYYYQNEGNYRCLDTSDVGDLAYLDVDNIGYTGFNITVKSFDFKASTTNRTNSVTASLSGWSFVCWVACYSTGHTLAGDCYFEYPQNATTTIWSTGARFTANSTIIKGIALFKKADLATCVQISGGGIIA